MLPIAIAKIVSDAIRMGQEMFFFIALLYAAFLINVRRSL